MKVKTCTYLTWNGIVEKHDGDLDAAKIEFDACMREGRWEEHAKVLFVLVDCSYEGRVVKSEVSR